MIDRFDRVVIVTRKTQVQELLMRHNTVDQARFYLQHANEDFAPLQERHDRYLSALLRLQSMAPDNFKLATIDRSFLPQFEFLNDIVIAIGQDGLVSNTAKYLSGQPLVGVNPDREFIEGVLLPWGVEDVEALLPRVVKHAAAIEQVTLAQVSTNDGRHLLAFNDVFIGQSGHASALYDIGHDGAKEFQSSSGIIVSTGAGSTGWYRSIQTGAQALATPSFTPGKQTAMDMLSRSEERLAFAVREPWPSRKTGTSIVFGHVTRDQPLLISSRMPGNGVIFSDGVEWDYIEFNSGTHATISIADHKALLVVK